MTTPDLDRIYVGDCLEIMKTWPDAFVHCVVTSPPYWGLRDYGTAEWQGGNPACEHKPIEGRGVNVDPKKNFSQVPGSPNRGGNPRLCACGARRVDRQLGLEARPDCLGWATGNPCEICFICRMVAVFREVRRVLRDDGVCWLNIGDCYASGGGSGKQGNGQREGRRYTAEIASRSKRIKRGSGRWGGGDNAVDGLKPKDLVLVPARLALALQADGWWVRSDVIWSKPNPMPESCTDRPTKAHEYVYLLTKSERYFYDAEAIREKASDSMLAQVLAWYDGEARKDFEANGVQNASEVKKRMVEKARALMRPSVPRGGFDGKTNELEGREAFRAVTLFRNKRTVWQIPTAPFPEAHFATFPPDLVKPCVLAGTSERGVCEACGAPWRRVVEVTYRNDTTKSGRPAQGNHSEEREDETMVAKFASGERTRRIAETNGWRPTCAHYPRVDEWVEIPSAKKPSEPTTEETAAIEAAIAKRAELLEFWAPLRARPGVVFDPFMGAGTVALVAAELNRRFIGTELNPEYAAMAERRVKGEVAQRKLL